MPYIGEIRMFAGSFAPVGWAFCNGQLIPISENESLYNLIGATYGGDDVTTFALPDLQGRLPMHMGSNGGGNHVLAEKSGTEGVILNVTQLPSHSHPFLASNDIPTGSSPAGNVTGQAAAKFYRAGNPALVMHPQALTQTGGGQPHSNMQPFLCVSFIISLFGIFPQS